MDVVLLVVALGVILGSAELFTNGIEWFGHKLDLAEGAVGSVLAAVATAMPETLIPTIAIVGPALSGRDPQASHEIGVGAILGAPFMLSTVAMFVTGAAVLAFARRGRRTEAMDVSTPVLGRDIGFFVIGYAIAIGTAFLPADPWIRWPVAALLLGMYLYYVRLHFADEREEGDASDLNRLHATRLPGVRRGSAIEVRLLPDDADERDHLSVATHHEPRMRVIVGQVVAAMVLIVVGAQVFVGSVDRIATAISFDRTILALIIAPIATELPEKFNSVLWVRNGKDTLAMGNITGAMVFQSCIPTVLGLLFTAWTFTPENAIGFASAGVAFVAVALIFGTMLRTGRLSAKVLLLGGPLYLVYLWLALASPLGGAAIGA
jgi:cation:H+ antiporter